MFAFEYPFSLSFRVRKRFTQSHTEATKQKYNLEIRSKLDLYIAIRGGKNILFSGTATKSGKIFCELSTQILYNLN
jgi:hypothetical protein